VYYKIVYKTITYDFYLSQEKIVMDIIICDLDQCVANDSNRRHLLARGDVEKYHRHCGEDDVHEPVLALLRTCYASDYMIYLVSTRPALYELDTIEWLKRKKIPYWRVLIDIMASGVPLAGAKWRIVVALNLVDKIQFVIDYDERSTRMWRAQKVPCFTFSGAYNA
jgi:L-rhamnose mutarotase